ncbi:MAG: type II toxin-antitoxin system RelB/DinJ family antitoxin [Oscillospiraceae bacterium]|nr:type II toxin-antitoxin system RelB/DinJ family antitoxin [Oscillospiraceae bacterium]
MAQVMVNFRMDEELKKNMEETCAEMGLSMTAAFTIFAKKVVREQRIPFEISAVSSPTDSDKHIISSKHLKFRLEK